MKNNTMTEERKRNLTELQGLASTASTAIAGVIQAVYTNNMQSDLDSNWQVGMGDLREAETTLDNLENLLGFKLEGLTGEELDTAMFDL